MQHSNNNNNNSSGYKMVHKMRQQKASAKKMKDFNVRKGSSISKRSELCKTKLLSKKTLLERMNI